MLVKNRCFELFEKRQNSTKFAALGSARSFSENWFMPIACEVLRGVCPKGVDGVGRGVRDTDR